MNTNQIHSELSVPKQYEKAYFYHGTKQIVDFTSDDGSIYKANKYAYSMARDTFSSAKSLGKSRCDKFSGSILNGAKFGARVGVGVGCLATIPLDMLLGAGHENRKIKPPKTIKELMNNKTPPFIEDGVVGHVAINTARGCTLVAEIGGNITGSIAGVVTAPASCGTNQTPGDWVVEGALKGEKFMGKVSSLAIGAPVGVALGISRLPSVLVKYTVSSAGAIVGGVFGGIAGLFRAIVNK